MLNLFVQFWKDKAKNKDFYFLQNVYHFLEIILSVNKQQLKNCRKYTCVIAFFYQYILHLH